MKLTKSQIDELEEILNAPVHIDEIGQALFNPGGSYEDEDGWILVPEDKINKTQK